MTKLYKLVVQLREGANADRELSSSLAAQVTAAFDQFRASAEEDMAFLRSIKDQVLSGHLSHPLRLTDQK